MSKKMDVVFEPTHSPRNIGMGVRGGDLWAISGCCGEAIHFDHREQRWYCSSCDGHICSKGDAPEWSSETLTGYDDAPNSLYRWVAQWVGVEEELLYIKLEWNETV